MSCAYGFFLIALAEEKNLWRAICRILPQIIVGCAGLLLHVYATAHATDVYAGIKMHIGRASIATFWKQLSGSSSMVGIFRHSRLIWHNLAGLIRDNGILRYAAVIGVTVLGVFLSAAYAKKQRPALGSARDADAIWSNVLLLAGAVWMMGGSALLIAVSQKYQAEVEWGRGYLPAYVQTWGFSICAAMALTWLSDRIDNIKRIGLLFSVLAMLLVIPGQLLGDFSVAARGNGSYMGDMLFREADRAGLFADWEEEERILDGNDCWYGIEEHYNYLLDYKVAACGYKDLYYMTENGLAYTEDGRLLRDARQFKYIHMPDLRSALLMANARSVEVGQDETGAVEVRVYSDDFYVYLSEAAPYAALVLSYDDGSRERLPFDGAAKVGESEDGAVYHFTLPEPANVRALPME